MYNAFTTARLAVLGLLCLILASCSQSSVSTHGGDLGTPNVSRTVSQTEKQAKIQAARKRAREASKKRRKSFVQKRKDRIAAKKSKSSNRKSARTSRKSNRKDLKANKSRLNRTRKQGRKFTSRGKVQKIRKTKAYVGNVSRKAGRLVTRAPWKCVPRRLKKVIAQVRKRYGRVTINSTWRSRKKNRRAGGKRGSYHLHCNAVDFRVHGSTRGLTRFLAQNPLVGGYNRYPSGFYHIDTGPKRTW